MLSVMTFGWWVVDKLQRGSLDDIRMYEIIGWGSLQCIWVPAKCCNWAASAGRYCDLWMWANKSFIGDNWTTETLLSNKSCSVWGRLLVIRGKSKQCRAMSTAKALLHASRDRRVRGGEFSMSVPRKWQSINCIIIDYNTSDRHCWSKSD